MLAVVPWILAHPGVTLGELAARFGIPERDLERDLEILPLCGLPPYTPDRLIEVDLVDDRVRIRMAEYLDRPLRFTAAEGFAILAAGRALLAVPGSDTEGPLVDALAKLARVLGPVEGVTVDIGAVGESDDLVRQLQDAVTGRRQLEIGYYSFGRDEETERVVDPWAVHSAGGQWYLAAWCHRAGDERLFRLDRIRSVRPTGETFAAPNAVSTPDSFQARDDDPRVELLLGPDDRWVVESYPTVEVDVLADGRLRAVLAVSGPAWFERLALRLGPGSTIVGPQELVGAARAAAARVLARYGVEVNR
jgi:proteasome accessory factor C